MAPFTFRKHHGSGNRPSITREQAQAAVDAQSPLPSLDEQAEMQPEDQEETVSAPVDQEQDQTPAETPAKKAKKGVK